MHNPPVVDLTNHDESPTNIEEQHGAATAMEEGRAVIEGFLADWLSVSPIPNDGTIGGFLVAWKARTGNALLLVDRDVDVSPADLRFLRIQKVRDMNEWTSRIRAVFPRLGRLVEKRKVSPMMASAMLGAAALVLHVIRRDLTRLCRERKSTIFGATDVEALFDERLMGM